MPLPKNFQNKIELHDITENEAITIQPSQLWRAAHEFAETIKLWASFGVSGTFALTFLTTVVTATDFREVFFISSSVWKAIFALGFVFSTGWTIISAYKLIRIYQTNGVTDPDKFVEKLFKKKK